LVVTAEPYFAVTQPSDAVVMENKVSAHTNSQIELVQAKYELLKRGQYTLNLAANEPMLMDPKIPFAVYQARNAVRIAQAAGAQAYAADPFGQAKTFLQQAESGEGGKTGRTLTARQAVQKAEDSRLIAVQRQQTEGIEQERRQAEAKLKTARQQAAAAEAEAQRQASLAKTENNALRGQLMAQLNEVLQTRASARGLIVNMSGVLFKTGKATLLPAAREKLAKIAGILAAHKGLKIEADGYTDSTGSDAFNRQLSEKRAMITKDYLVQMGVPADAIIFKGFGVENPIASNETDAGRQENRRVELVVTGEGATAPEK
jgi:outer membrane protein OmpA-like peptidoglycan-associated protein